VNTWGRVCQRGLKLSNRKQKTEKVESGENKKMVDAELARKFRIPIEFMVAMPNTKSMVVLPDGMPKMEMTLQKVVIKTVGDMVIFDKAWRAGEFVPVPDLSLQVFNMLAGLLGMIEDSTLQSKAEPEIATSDVPERK
jgi:hypothetical protein